MWCLYYYRNAFYNGNLDLPIFKNGQVEFNVEQLVHILLGSVSPEKVCKTKPVCVQHSCTFIVDLNYIADADDLRADDCGVWKHRGFERLGLLLMQKAMYYVKH